MMLASSRANDICKGFLGRDTSMFCHFGEMISNILVHESEKPRCSFKLAWAPDQSA